MNHHFALIDFRGGPFICCCNFNGISSGGGTFDPELNGLLFDGGGVNLKLNRFYKSFILVESIYRNKSSNDPFSFGFSDTEVTEDDTAGG